MSTALTRTYILRALKVDVPISGVHTHTHTHSVPRLGSRWGDLRVDEFRITLHALLSAAVER